MSALPALAAVTLTSEMGFSGAGSSMSPVRSSSSSSSSLAAAVLAFFVTLLPPAALLRDNKGGIK